jgi:hypothetical protein
MPAASTGGDDVDAAVFERRSAMDDVVRALE